MSPLRRRIFIAIDEWLGIALLLYLWKTHDEAFTPVLFVFLVMVYVISYPAHWIQSLGNWWERKSEPEPTLEQTDIDQYHPESNPSPDDKYTKSLEDTNS